jgi:RNA polymerase sigma-70 factor (ECF subfamily)
MAEKEPFYEDPLEQLLDEETDEEFGLPEFKEHFADTLTPAVLKDWTAADFASIYVRFRPHLERHAKRFLSNPSQVEEVVQDAFLYLMTTLPELDSEIGVLKFLKWKTRLLALDVIRVNSKAKFAPIDEQFDLADNSPELSQAMERADDAAIVALALAKLQPRHREALIATIYEEKTTDVVAAQMGLSENATRQLLFRARSAFKKALIGEADTAGLSMGQILSLAARKAAAESGKYITAAGAFLLVLAVSLGLLPNFTANQTENIAQVEPTQQPTTPAPTQAPGPTAELEDPTETLVAQPALAQQPSPQATPSQLREELKGVLGATTLARISSGKETSLRITESSAGTVFVLDNGSGFTALTTYDPADPEGFSHVSFEIQVGNLRFIAVPKLWAAMVTEQEGLTTINLAATDLIVGDASGNLNNMAWEDSQVSYSKIRLSVTLDETGQPVAQTMSISR